MKKQNVIIAGLALALTVSTVSLSAANEPMNAPMTGCGMMNKQNNQDLTPAQLEVTQTIEKKYQASLTAGETAIRSKGAELDKALADGSTTVATLNSLRNELAGLEQEYRQLRNQINGEISARIGFTYYSSGGWGPDNCPWHNDHGNSMTGRNMMHGRGMMGQNMGAGHPEGMYCCR